MSLRFKLTAFVSVLGAAMTLLTLLLVNQILSAHFRRAALADLRAARETLTQSLDATLDVYAVQARVIADATLLKEALIRDSAELAYTYADSARDQTAVSTLVVTDKKGNVLADAKGEFAKGKALPYLDGRSGAEKGFVLLRGALEGAAVAPIAIDGQVLGRLMLGEPVTAQRLQTARRSARSEITLLAPSGKRLVSTLPDGAADEAASRFGALRSAGTERISLSGVPTLATLEPLAGLGGTDVGYVLLTRSLEDQESARRDIQAWLLGLGALFTVVAVAGGALVGTRIGKPIRALTALAQRIAKGEVAPEALEDDTSAADSAMMAVSRDEIATLSTAFRIMARAVAFRQERLEKEMELAHAIQRAILPTSFDVPGLAISAEMIPATEVGGDYFDVIAAPDGCWIGIGDVAGHGLNAGLTMLMIQSMIAALVAQNADASPDAVVTVVNDALFGNVRERLKKDDHATLTLLRYRSDGSVVFAGAHEEILVLREATGAVEVVPTTGTWVAARRDIGAFTKSETIKLSPGDLLVLYTDGITEARGSAGEMLGLERLCDEIVKVRGLPVAGIREHVLALAGAFGAERADDMSLVVARFAGLPTGT